jgi:hypothetical protein
MYKTVVSLFSMITEHGHIPVAMDMHMRMVLSAWAVLRSYKEDNWGNQSQFCMEI